jgi:Ser/Thr protein kinase RdoA (MazF antagonist)
MAFWRAKSRWPEGKKRAGVPTLEELDWENNSMYNRETVNRVLRQDPSPLYRTSPEKVHTSVDYFLSRKDQIFIEYDNAAKWMKGLSTSGRPLLRAVIHGDLYPSNLLWEGRRITGILDWDSCQYEPLVYELGRVLWEYCKEKGRGTIDRSREEFFIDSYFNAGGPVPRDQMDLAHSFIRMLRIMELLFYLQNAVIGDYWDAEYTAENMKALENLPSF